MVILYALATLLLLLACLSPAECGEQERHMLQSRHNVPQSRVLSYIQPLTPVEQSVQARPMADLPQRAQAQLNAPSFSPLPPVVLGEFPPLPHLSYGQLLPNTQQLPSSSAFTFDLPVDAALPSKRRFTAPELPSLYQPVEQRFPQHLKGRPRHQLRGSTRKAETATPTGHDLPPLAQHPQLQEVLHGCHFCPAIFVSTLGRDLHQRACAPSAIALASKAHDLLTIQPDIRAQQWRQKVREMSRWVNRTRSETPALESEKHRIIDHVPWKQNLYSKTFQGSKEDDAYQPTGESS